MKVYLLSNPLFCGEGVKMTIFTRDLETNYRVIGENDFRKMAASLFYFYKEIGRSISYIC